MSYGHASTMARAREILREASRPQTPPPPKPKS